MFKFCPQLLCICKEKDLLFNAILLFSGCTQLFFFLNRSLDLKYISLQIRTKKRQNELSFYTFNTRMENIVHHLVNDAWEK